MSIVCEIFSWLFWLAMIWNIGNVHISIGKSEVFKGPLTRWFDSKD